MNSGSPASSSTAVEITTEAFSYYSYYANKTTNNIYAVLSVAFTVRGSGYSVSIITPCSSLEQILSSQGLGSQRLKPSTSARRTNIECTRSGGADFKEVSQSDAYISAGNCWRARSLRLVWNGFPSCYCMYQGGSPYCITYKLHSSV